MISCRARALKCIVLKYKLPNFASSKVSSSVFRLSKQCDVVPAYQVYFLGIVVKISYVLLSNTAPPSPSLTRVIAGVKAFQS